MALAFFPGNPKAFSLASSQMTSADRQDERACPACEPGNSTEWVHLFSWTGFRRAKNGVGISISVYILVGSNNMAPYLSEANYLRLPLYWPICYL